jgi:ribosomal protein L7Ae-like RNA K-turn-binding protein
MSVAAESQTKVVTLMQFARRAGKLVYGYDACLRAMHHNKLYLVIIAEDTAPRTQRGITFAIAENRTRIPVMVLGSQADLSAALGLPISGVFGLGDKQFASAILKYDAEQFHREEPCK